MRVYAEGYSVERYLVTGGAGFIGSHLAEALLRRGAQVRVLDNLSSGRQQNLAPFSADIELIVGDVRDSAVLRRAVGNVDVVLHQAALVSVPVSVADPLSCHDTNAGGTLNVLLAAREAGVRRVVLASTCALYGASPALPSSERAPPDPCSPYAASKAAAEHYCQVFSAIYDLPTIALRYFNVFGPRQDPSSQYAAVIPLFISKMARGEAPTVYGDGQQTRDFVYVEDVVAANLLAAAAPASVSGCFNVAHGQSTSLLELIGLLNRILGTELQPIFAPPRPGDVRHSQADPQRARDLLGFAPRFSLQAGLAQTVDYFYQQTKTGV